MRNIFKRVYCEDCQNMILNTEDFTDPDLQLDQAKCKADPLIRGKHIRRVTKVADYWYCSSRVFPFCFKFVAKGEQE